jgi:hypothetical protein
VRRALRHVLTPAGWLTVAVGVLHLGVAAVQYRALSVDALWFAGSGLAVMLIGVLTLLARPAPARAAVRWAALAANGAGLALAVGFGALTRWREPQGPILVALFLAGGLAAMSRPDAPPDVSRGP